MQWIALQVLTGQENNTARTLERLINKSGLQHLVESINSYVREVVKFTTGKVKEEPVMPGYILLKAELTDDLWHFLRICPGVINILGRIYDDESVTSVENEYCDLAELEVADSSAFEALKEKFREIIALKKEKSQIKKKTIIRLPLKLVANLSSRVMVSFHRLAERKLVDELLTIRMAI